MALSHGENAGVVTIGTPVPAIDSGFTAGHNRNARNRKRPQVRAPGKRRRLLFKPPEKPVEIRRPAPCADHDAFGIVPHITGKPAIARQAPNRGTKTDALHKPADADRPPFFR